MNGSINERITNASHRPNAAPRVELLSIHARDLLNVRRLQGRLNARQTAALLNCNETDIPVLVNRGLITPLGNPPPNSTKYFSPAEVLDLAGDPERMGAICNALYRHWQDKNAAKTKGSQRRDIRAQRSDLDHQGK